MIGWDPKTEVAPSPVGEKNEKKNQLLEGARGRQTQSQLLWVKKTKTYLGHEGPKFFKPVLKIA